jgi:hypothetical protein
LGFAWEINDIRIDMTTGGDYIEINGTSFNLNDTLDLTFSNITTPIYCWDNTTNESIVCDYIPIPYFYIKEDMPGNRSESLYLRWNESLNYRVQVKSRDGQYNAPVTLGIKIGTLGVGQEKYTSLFWYDALEKVFYFDDCEDGGPNEWETNPSYMVDSNISIYASTTINNDRERCNNNTCDGTDLGTISKVEIRCLGYHGYLESQADNIVLRPIFNAKPGDDHTFVTSTSGDWSQWFDITNDPNVPEGWIWSDVEDLFCDVVAIKDPYGPPIFTLYCSKVELRVTYTSYNNDPVISSPVPVDGATGVGIQPMLSITVSDSDGDLMNITWLSNSSGSWQVFGTNSSVVNGTYHQTMNNSSENGKWWYWKVNVSDGENYTESSAYKYYTGCESKIENTGSTDISGYLLMQVQYYSDRLEDWVVVDDTIDEDSPRTITAGGYLALDSIFNGRVNSSILRYGNGTYRVYVALRDPNCNVLKWDDDVYMEGPCVFDFSSCCYDWTNLFPDGFGLSTNRASRAMEIYDGDLYVGTQNVNGDKFWDIGILGCNGFLAGTDIKMANESYKDIEDIEVDDQVKAYDIDNNSYVTANVTDVFCLSYDEVLPEYYVTINNKLHISPNHSLYVNGTLTNASDLVTGDFLVDVNGSNVTVNSLAEVSTNNKKMYNLMVSVNPEENPIQGNLTYFTEDIQVYPLGSDGFLPTGILDLDLLILSLGWFARAFLRRVGKTSDGCEIWKYDYGTDDWIEVVGRNGEDEESSGFGDHCNWNVGAMKEFNDELYVGTWQSSKRDLTYPFDDEVYGGQIWRYDGLEWEQVVGPDAADEGGYNGGFGDRDNHICRMEVFKNSNDETHLYVGTMNFNGYDGGCEIWRTSTGDADTADWERVVDKGFSGKDDFDEDEDAWNAYAWSMEVFENSNDENHLYVGTFNIELGDNGGCQLWRTATGAGGDDDWEKVDLKNGDGFGEGWDNYGIRNMVNYSGSLYCGTGTNTGKIETSEEDEIQGIEIWKYNGIGSDGNGWVCIVGDDSDILGERYDDGFGDHYNKYAWSMTICGNKLWTGTSNNQIVSENGELKYDTNGCEVWWYDEENLEASVKNGYEIGNGFGNKTNVGAWSMIEYPESNGYLVVGTNKGMAIWPPNAKLGEGCEIWIRDLQCT